MAADEYTQAMRYEMLIRNAFNCKRGSRNGAELSYMQNAMTMERGEIFAKRLGSFEKQFEKVKNYTSKGLIKLTMTKPFSDEFDFFTKLNEKLEYISSTTELMDVVNNAMDKVIEIKKR